MKEIHLHRIDLNLLVVFEVLMDTGSVASAAKMLNKTPSAVSHALGRMREQMGDPLMVSVGGKMRPSPFALRLIDDVRPILRSVERAFQPLEPFDPATSHRIFRISTPTVSAWVTKTTMRVHAVAPNVGLEWVPYGATTFADVADEKIDIALHSAAMPLPGGLLEDVLPPLKRYVFARDGHPALDNWTKRAWLRWPHITVGMSHGAPEPVSERVAILGVERRIGARVSDFSGIAPLIAGTNMLSNQVAVMLGHDIETYDLRVLEPPVELPDFRFRFFWSERLGNTSESRWIRKIVAEAFHELSDEAEDSVTRQGVLQPAR
ncbi:LysR family transcriptional regulator [Ruegeria sp. 2205SS24-7]|uniref:LysR family transcriptional regulator n=1 Tax=Ruegeria discodermiae TaxID=3064389 RepID=UPI002741834B|nr:LysR family transcriptional regulator [Ruegeria sp. 2205SS24-7]MDP5220820.1 LysR family transcriptional regulator [Ruegeria sp. 2205SS24-7]